MDIVQFKENKLREENEFEFIDVKYFDETSIMDASQRELLNSALQNAKYAFE